MDVRMAVSNADSVSPAQRKGFGGIDTDNQMAAMMVVHAGGNDARLAPAPGNLFYQIGTYLYQLDVNPGRSTSDLMVDVQMPCWLWLIHYHTWSMAELLCSSYSTTTITSMPGLLHAW